MKFLCVPCDQPMKLKDVLGPNRGSVALLYACADCGSEIAMLTNPHETQLVTSLGVQIGVDGKETVSRCPFTGMLEERAAGATPEAAETAAGDTSDTDLRWTPTAAERLASIPEPFRPMAKSGIEGYAREQGLSEITTDILDAARSHFGV